MGSLEDSEHAPAIAAAVEMETEQLFAAKLDGTISATASPGDEQDVTDVAADAAATVAAQLESDAALAAAMSFEDPVFVSCQICMDVLLVDEVVTKLCGDACAAEVCAECLVQHLTASVYSFYPGVLPKVRCPICLTLLGKSAWQRFVKPEAPAASEPESVAATFTADAALTEPEPSDAVEGESDVTEGEQQDATDGEQRDEDETTTTEEEQQDVPAVTAAPTTTDDSWRLDHSHVLEKYEILCRQSCEFQSPCCHNPEYTMLPPFSEDAEAALAALLESQAQSELLAPLLARCRAFCAHQIETQAFYAFLAEPFADACDDVLMHVLEMMSDEERRATLLLYHLFLHPDTRTRCCDEIVCFKCKASVHHDGLCDDFIEDDCVLQCRGCHVTLVKVDGCDSVSCVCGHSIHWPSEMEKQRAQRKQLAPTDDTEHALWSTWKQRAQRSFSKICALERTLRELRLARLVRKHRPALRCMLLRYKTAKQQQHAEKEQKRKHEEAEQAAAGDNALTATEIIPTESAASEQAKAAAAMPEMGLPEARAA